MPTNFANTVSKPMLAQGWIDMNERIKQLAFEAGLKWKAQPPHYTNTNNPIDFPVSANRDLEKFAELIVKECANIADIADENKCEWIGGNILTHFGVEE